ncbi:A/G-specific DNA-adenine glycosylase [Tamilnaduibacter salinus]|uniref:Adenine DNA glycosylase n=1 Tax=Tamilnaduibacter salinus TaxID=1484056 RepID=A0A2U1CW63_9GAMM|nr:A/G-specific adenine glycosylase [Tamilnaduibacter salinus]PVY75888.1 A/G-specific DNA-adenine glycosylase [Tamilnaduibacter salinus]
MTDTFAERLLDWYDRHGRKDLPWHHNQTPYRVWVSEIMLQQTQVATVIPYFRAFMERFPDVRALAEAPTDDVLQHWSGLGYYARARNLQKAAQAVMAEHGGEFPTNQDALEALPGIGRSTAAAILAQSHGIRAAILDGNVKRVLARYHAVHGWPGRTAVVRELWRHAEAHTPDTRIRDYTQAIMDLGAMVCGRRQPDCHLCPVNDGCEAHAQGLTEHLPERKPKKAKPQKETWALVLEDGDGRLLMERRPPNGIWGGLWSLPELDPAITLDELPEAVERQLGLACSEPDPLPDVRHTFSHYHLQIHPVRMVVQGQTAIADNDQSFVAESSIPELGLPAPIRKLLESRHQTSLLEGTDAV